VSEVKTHTHTKKQQHVDSPSVYSQAKKILSDVRITHILIYSYTHILIHTYTHTHILIYNIQSRSIDSFRDGNISTDDKRWSPYLTLTSSPVIHTHTKHTNTPMQPYTHTHTPYTHIDIEEQKQESHRSSNVLVVHKRSKSVNMDDVNVDYTLSIAHARALFRHYAKMRYVCMYGCMYICMYVCIYIYIYMYVCMYVSARVYVLSNDDKHQRSSTALTLSQQHTHTKRLTKSRPRMYVCMYMYVCMNVYVYVCMSVCIQYDIVL